LLTSQAAINGDHDTTGETKRQTPRRGCRLRSSGSAPPTRPPRRTQSQTHGPRAASLPVPPIAASHATPQTTRTPRLPFPSLYLALLRPHIIIACAPPEDSRSHKTTVAEPRDTHAGPHTATTMAATRRARRPASSSSHSVSSRCHHTPLHAARRLLVLATPLPACVRSTVRTHASVAASPKAPGTREWDAHAQLPVALLSTLSGGLSRLSKAAGASHTQQSRAVIARSSCGVASLRF